MKMKTNKNYKKPKVSIESIIDELNNLKSQPHQQHKKVYITGELAYPLYKGLKPFVRQELELDIHYSSNPYSKLSLTKSKWYIIETDDMVLYIEGKK